MKSKIIVLLLLLSSCSVVTRVVFGVKQPKPRSAEYIQKYADKYQLNNFEQYSISDRGFVGFFENSKHLNIRNSINQVIIFNKNGKLIQPKDSITCSGQIDEFIAHYNDSNLNKVYDTVEFKDVFGDSISSLHQANQYFSPENGKPLFVITWASFVGKLNKNSSKQWADSVQKIITDNSANAIFINFDMRENWDLEKYISEKQKD